MGEIKHINPTDNFKNVAESAIEELEVGIIIGYSKDDDELHVFAGGLIDGKRPVHKDWLWMIESFKNKLMNGDYFEE